MTLNCQMRILRNLGIALLIVSRFSQKVRIRKMIDTLRVRAALPYNVWMKLEKEKSFGVISPGLLKLKNYLLIPPYDAIVTVSTQDFKYVYLEASLPKIAYGHNVKLL